MILRYHDKNCIRFGLRAFGRYWGDKGEGKLYLGISSVILLKKDCYVFPE